MAYVVPVVAYAAANDFEGTYTALTGIQSVQINRGRNRFQDQFNQTTCVVELIPANSYALPLEVGQWIDVRVLPIFTAAAWFTGRISDVQRDYNFPYNTGTGAAPADRITITAVGAMGAIGQSGNAIMIGASTADARENMVNLMAGIDVYMDEYISLSGSTDKWNKFGVSTTIDAGTTQSNLDLMNWLANAGQAFIDDVDLSRLDAAGQNFMVNAYNTSSREIVFSDNPDG